MEEKGFDVAAFSGSSAGALIACLAWAGYRADELLAEIQELLRDPGLDSTLRNLKTDPRQDQLLADIVKLYQAIGGPSRWGKLANIRDALRVLKLVSLVKRSNAFEHRGLYDGEGLEAWIDRLLRCKLDALRLENGFGPVETPVTFAHFFETYEAIGKWRQPLLLMGVTNLSREDS